MNKTAVIIPSRLNAQRFPNKPLKLIKNKEMILHVYDAAKKSKSGEVYVASPDEEIIEKVKKYGGKAIQTSDVHKTGTDRIFEVFKKTLNSNPDIIVNLQGDMPNINPESISYLVSYMTKNKCDIGTLASDFKNKYEIEDTNAVKVKVEGNLNDKDFLAAVDFFRKKTESTLNLYHHIGIYAFTNKALVRYVNFERSKKEIERNLEQLRALENNMSIHVGYTKSPPLSVDTEKDLIEVEKLI